ncbi:ferritin-like domain-containing protein [Nodosilinea sp. LEGE 06152]|uniref:ferritin-like domain-containing protein n=1 Tax=Nodosilinea sp. LEGE 06152 TaxID=2777966 RepID=UPI001881493C|nr:ferritin-like domain-containing protein [Nodosilinea sp. LEGE 06152]MBE9158998.1 ferritin-like domain-containing protein [Nodosilinea sp. LEGE 06152]
MNHDLMSANPDHPKAGVSRRRVMVGGAIAGLAGSLGFSALTQSPAQAQNRSGSLLRNRAAANDIAILNGALYYEHQAIWAYGAAAGGLSDTDVGKAVLAIALANQADHMAHRDLLSQVITDLGGRPVMAVDSYDLSAYLERGDGGLDSDVNIAKLALALETDAAIAYASEVARLRTPELITAGATIAAAEASHATTIRAAFISLGVDIPFVPAPFVSADTRDQWVLKV